MAASEILIQFMFDCTFFRDDPGKLIKRKVSTKPDLINQLINGEFDLE